MMRRLVVLTLVLELLPLRSSPASGAPRRKPRRGADQGTLVLKSMTDGATVSVDGKEIGRVPLGEPILLRAGKHTLKLVKPGYTEYLDVFTVVRDKATELDIDLLPYAGILQISSTIEGARVFIDGKYEGVTPLEREVLLGKRTIRVTKAGYYDFIATVKSVAGKTRRLNAHLRMLPVGSTPYRPKPLSPPKWYEKWYVWAGGAGALAAITVAIVVPVTMTRGNKINDWGYEKLMHVTPK